MKLRRMLSMAMVGCMMLSAMAFSAGAVENTDQSTAQGVDVYVYELSDIDAQPQLVSHSVNTPMTRAASSAFADMSVTNTWFNSSANIKGNSTGSAAEPVFNGGRFKSGDDCLGVYITNPPNTVKTINVRLHRNGDTGDTDPFYYEVSVPTWSSDRDVMLYFVNGESYGGYPCAITASNDISYAVYASSNYLTGNQSAKVHFEICPGIYNG